jgi:hypothetical protein
MAPDVTSQPQFAAASGEPASSVGDDGRVGWQHVVAVVAAAAGGAAWVSAVGSAIVGLRLDNAGLPVESVVALMSAEHRFAIGAGYLIAPLFVGLVGFAVDWLVIKRWHDPRDTSAAPERGDADRDNQTRSEPAGGAAESKPANRKSGDPSTREHSLPAKRFWAAMLAIFAASLVGGLLIQPPAPLVFILQCAALLGIVLVALAVYRDRPRDHHRLDERVIVFVLVVVSAGAIALGYEQLFADATFDAADIRLREGATVQGGYVTTTDTAVLLITRHSNDCPAITAVRRDQIEQVSIGPTQVKVSLDDPQFCTRTEEWRDPSADER